MSRRLVEQLAEVAVDLRHVARLEAEQAQVAGRALDDAQLAVGDELLLGGAVARGKNMSSSMGITNVLAWMRPNAAARSPPVWRLTSPRCHFQAMHRRSLGSIGWK